MPAAEQSGDASVSDCPTRGAPSDLSPMKARILFPYHVSNLSAWILVCMNHRASSRLTSLLSMPSPAAYQAESRVRGSTCAVRAKNGA